MPFSIRELQTHPNLHSRLSGQTAVIPSERAQICVCVCVFVPIWLVLPRCEATNLGVFDLCHFALLKRGCVNSGVLELADMCLFVWFLAHGMEASGLESRLSQCSATVRHCRCYTRRSATPFYDIDMANLRCYTPPPREQKRLLQCPF